MSSQIKPQHKKHKKYGRVSKPCKSKHESSQCTSEEDHHKLHLSEIRIDSSVQPGIGLKIFGTGLNRVKKIIINGDIITQFTIVSKHEITVTVPDNGQTIFTVTVASKKCMSNTITYNIVSPPVIDRIDPSSGGMFPFLSITIYGTNFSSLKYIIFNGIKLCKSNNVITIMSDELVSFIVPYMNINGEVPITVVNCSGESNTVYYTVIPRPII